MSDLREALLKHQNPDLLAILWISTHSLLKVSQDFIALDDLMDGLLTQGLQIHPKVEKDSLNRIQLMATPYFDGILHLAHINFDNAFIQDDLSSLLQNMVHHTVNRSCPIKIIVLHEGKTTGFLEPVLLKLQGQFPQFNLETLVIEN